MISFDGNDLLAELDRLERACDQLPEIAQTVRAEALGHLIQGAQRNVYNTTPGAYERTQDLLRGLDAQARITRNQISITVSGSAPYHREVELGSGATELTVPQAQAYALANPNPAAPLYLGRTGQKYSLPGPIVLPAQAFAAYRLAELFAQALRR